MDDPMTTETAAMFMERRDEAELEIKRLRARLEALTNESERRIAAKDRVIADQERVIIELERAAEQRRKGPSS